MSQEKNVSPLKAIRTFCLEGEGGSAKGVADCLDLNCPVREYRFGKPPATGKHRPLSAIKRYCHDYCQAGSGRAEVVNCQGDSPLLESFGPCPFFRFRLGKNPNIKTETREKLKTAALKRVSSGTFNPSKTRTQTPIDLSSFNESTPG